MNLPKECAPAAGDGRGAGQALGRGLQAQFTPAPVELFKTRHGGRFTRSGKGFRCNCVLCGDKKQSLAVSESDGWLRLHCFKCGADRVALLNAVGLKLSDVGPPRTWPESPDARRAARRAMRETGWAAALSTLALEARIAQLASAQLSRGEPLSACDDERLGLAVARIASAASALTETPAWRPEVRA